MRTVSRPGRAPAPWRTIAALATLAVIGLTAGPLLAQPGGELKAAEKVLKKALGSGDISAVDKAVYTIREVGTKKGADILIGFAKKMPPGQEQLYWRLVNGASSFRDFEGLERVGKTIEKGGAIGRDLLYAMQNNRSPEVPEAVHRQALLGGAIDIQLMAADQLGAIKRVEAVDVLLDGYEKFEKKGGELAMRIERALANLTGADLGGSENWRKWWEIARAEGLKKDKNSSGTGTVVDTIDDPRFPEIEELTKLTKDQILVMTTDCPRSAAACNFDNIGGLLDQMDIPYTPVTKQQLEKGQISLDGVLAVLLTCTQINDHCTCPTCVASSGPKTNRMTQCTGCDKHDLTNHKMKPEGIKKMQAFVQRGGYVFTEDWGVADLLADAWPKFVKKGKSLKGRSARVTPARGQTSHPLLRGVFIDPDVAEKSGEEEKGGTVGRNPGDEPLDIGTIERFWTIDDESPLLEIVSKGKVTVLMSSPDLAKDEGAALSAVAVTFLPGGAAGEKGAVQGKLETVRGGRVLHVLSHFAKQKSDQDAFALQNMLLNFLMEAHRRQKISARGRKARKKS
ncbi:MAG: hypothetical protein ACYS22_12205 [Planctomycetota bacterium]|jgi:hypothetical protein